MYKTPIKIFYRPEMSFKDTSNKQFSINRDKPRLFVEYLQKSELKDSIEIVQNREKIDDKDLLLGHTQEYLSDFFSADPRIEASIGIKLTPEYLESTKYEVSTLYHAIKYALQYPETITHSLAC
jgi:acetoin utilization deacetylase AcuC-like enzyme